MDTIGTIISMLFIIVRTHFIAVNRLSESAFTIAEAIVSMAVALIGLAAVMGLNAAHLRLVESARQSSSATFALQSRIEQMRLADWRKLTDATYVKDTLLAKAPQS